MISQLKGISSEIAKSVNKISSIRNELPFKNTDIQSNKIKSKIRKYEEMTSIKNHS